MTFLSRTIQWTISFFHNFSSSLSHSTLSQTVWTAALSLPWICPELQLKTPLILHEDLDPTSSVVLLNRRTTEKSPMWWWCKSRTSPVHLVDSPPGYFSPLKSQEDPFHTWGAELYTDHLVPLAGSITWSQHLVLLEPWAHAHTDTTSWSHLVDLWCDMWTLLCWWKYLTAMKRSGEEL